MKKKRSGKKKSTQNNKPNNDGTAEVTIVPDKHHNNSRPCSALAASISKEIFPSIPSSNNDTDDLSTGKLLLTQQPLFAFIILRHMIEERKKIRDEEKGVVDKQSADQSTALSSEEELNTLLDSYIDSKEACDILDNEAKRWGKREIESFVTYLSQNFDCHAKKLQKKSSNSLELQNMLNADALALKDILPTISSMDVALLQSIECSMCRKSFDEQLSKVIDKPITLNGDNVVNNNNVIESSNLSIGQEVNIISYEDGQGRNWPSGQGTIHEIYYDIYTKADTISVKYSSGKHWKQQKVPIKYVKIPKYDDDSPDNTNRNNNVEEVIIDDIGEYELVRIDMQISNGMEKIQTTLRSIDDLYVVVRDGLSTIYPPPESRDIELVMSQAGCSRARAIRALQLNDYDLVNAIMALTGSDNCATQILDPTRVKQLYGYDEQLDLGFKQLADLLLQIFKLTSFVGWSATRGFKLLDFTNFIFDRYNHALDKLIDPVHRYRVEMLRAVDSGGQVPDAYNNRSVTDCLFQFAEVKLATLGKLLTDMEDIIKHGSHLGETSSMVELLVLQEYRLIAEHPEVAAEDVFPNQASEELMIRLIATMQTICSSSASGSRVHREEMESLCSKFRKIIVVAMEDKLLDTGIDFLDEYYAQYEDKYSEIQQKKQKSPTEACNMSILLQESHYLIMQMLILLCVRQCNESSMEPLALPRDVDKWLDSIVDSIIPNPAKKKTLLYLEVAEPNLVDIPTFVSNPIEGSSTTNESKQSSIPNGERNRDKDIEKQQKYNGKDSSNKHPSSLQLELLPISQDSDNDHYLQVATGKEGVEYPINVQDMIALTKHIILPKKMEVQEGVDVLPHDMTDLQVYKSGEVLRESHTKLKQTLMRSNVASYLLSIILIHCISVMLIVSWQWRNWLM